VSEDKVTKADKLQRKIKSLKHVVTAGNRQKRRIQNVRAQTVNREENINCEK
jgi:hypothetical protein